MQEINFTICDTPSLEQVWDVKHHSEVGTLSGKLSTVFNVNKSVSHLYDSLRSFRSCWEYIWIGSAKYTRESAPFQWIV